MKEPVQRILKSYGGEEELFTNYMSLTDNMNKKLKTIS